VAVLFLSGAVTSASGNPSAFLATHPAALAFVQTPKPSPASFATEAYFGVTAFRFTNQAGIARYGRYRIVPQAGVVHLSDAEVNSKSENYLLDEISARVGKGVRFDLHVQIANDGDTVDDATTHWPSSRAVLPLGTIALTAIAPDDDTHRRIIFDPIPRVDGIEPYGDPLLELRAAIYLLSGRRRRQAGIDGATHREDLALEQHPARRGEIERGARCRRQQRVLVEVQATERPAR